MSGLTEESMRTKFTRFAAAGVAYAVWQTFRADDELWVADDEPGGPASTSGSANGSPTPVI